MRKISIVALVVLAVISAKAQSEMVIPSPREIALLREQVTKAVDKYQPLLDRQHYFDAAQRDRQVGEVGELRTYVEKIAAEPQEFNGILGFVVIETLHDVKDYATACSQSYLGFKQDLADACKDAALSMIGAINNAQDLYARYIKVLSAKGCSTDPPSPRRANP